MPVVPLPVRPGGRHRSLLRAGGVAALVAPLVVLAAAPAQAHTELVSATPASGASVRSAPSAVSLTFTEAVQSIGLTVKVTGPDGSDATSGEPSVDGVSVVQPLAGLSVDGTYTVAYRVVADDGHPVTGSYRFTLALPSATTTPTSPASSTGSASAPVASESAVPAPSSSDAAAAGSGAATGWLVAGAGLLVLLVVVGVVLARRSRP